MKSKWKWHKWLVSLPHNSFHSPCAICHILLFLLAWWWAMFETITASSAWTSKHFTEQRALMPHKVTRDKWDAGVSGWDLVGNCYRTISQPSLFDTFGCSNIFAQDPECKHIPPFIRLLKKKMPFLKPWWFYIFKTRKQKLTFLLSHHLFASGQHHRESPLEQKILFPHIDYKSGGEKLVFPLETHTWLNKNIQAKLMTNICKE